MAADLLRVVSDRTGRAFNRSGATRTVALDISKAFDRVCWSSSQTEVLWNFRSDIWPYFLFSQYEMASSGSARKVFTRTSS